MRTKIFIWFSLFLTLTFLLSTKGLSQVQVQAVKGIVTDRERGIPLEGANVIVEGSSPLIGTVSDSEGKFRLMVPVGRQTIRVSFMGYQDYIVRDILVSTGKQVDLPVELSETVVRSKEVFVSAGKNDSRTTNPMATVSARSLRASDALRFAGGYYDPSRMVNSFAGVSTANNDESNDIIIRGNSSRGLLWRLEGVEIPNPNHFSDGQGGSGGAYSAITSNAILSLDFLTGAFPAEFGNALSGVMDLNLRKGNSDKHEFAFQTGMIGLELAAEGPFSDNKKGSYLVDARYVNFSILSDLRLIDLGETNFAPRSQDLVYNFSFPTSKAGSFNVFGFAGRSALGKTADHDYNLWQTPNDRWEEMESISSFASGIKHILPLKKGNSYIRSVAAFTFYRDSYSEGSLDSSYIRTDSYAYDFKYPSVRLSEMINSRITSSTVLRTGFNLSFLYAEMKDLKLLASGLYDTLVNPSGNGIMTEFYSQLKIRSSEKLEFNYGFHVLSYSVNGEMSLEPRAGMRWQVAPGNFFNLGLGLHSKVESFPVYYNLIKSNYDIKLPLNRDLRFSKSFHFVAGTEFTLSENTRLKIEFYNQRLFDVPIVNNKDSRYSAINSSEDLPSSKLSNKGRGYNRGLEFTLERSYSADYYFLATLSVFDSKYRAGNYKWYNTYYNTLYVTNILGGKDFYFGTGRQNCIGVNLKMLARGGYRYTPVDIDKSIRRKQIIYSSNTYGASLPGFLRIDGGIYYRRNSRSFSWVIMADIQNVTGRKNVFRKRYAYTSGSVTETEVRSLGTIPVMNFRIEF